MPTLRHSKLDDVTYVLFEFLRISPSYRRAHQMLRRRPVRASVAAPRDFEQVKATYRRYGNVFLTFHDDWWAATAEKSLRLHPSKHQRETLMHMLQLVWFIAGKRTVNRKGKRVDHAGSITHHRIATKLNVTGRNRTKPGMLRRAKSDLQQKKRRNAGIQVDGLLKRAYRIAENAARGSFPNERPLVDEANEVDFVGQQLYSRIRMDLRWELRIEREDFKKRHPGTLHVQYGRFDTVL